MVPGLYQAILISLSLVLGSMQSVARSKSRWRQPSLAGPHIDRLKVSLCFLVGRSRRSARPVPRPCCQELFGSTRAALKEARRDRQIFRIARFGPCHTFPRCFWPLLPPAEGAFPQCFVPTEGPQCVQRQEGLCQRLFRASSYRTAQWPCS